MVELVNELEKLNDGQLKDKMIDLAKRGQFHDFKSSHTCGKVYFVECSKFFQKKILEFDGNHDEDIKKMQTMEDDIKNGEYDEKPDAEDRAEMASWIDKDKSMNAHQKNKMKDMFKLNNNVKHGPFGKNYFQKGPRNKGR